MSEVHARTGAGCLIIASHYSLRAWLYVLVSGCSVARMEIYFSLTESLSWFLGLLASVLYQAEAELGGVCSGARC